MPQKLRQFGILTRISSRLPSASGSEREREREREREEFRAAKTSFRASVFHAVTKSSSQTPIFLALPSTKKRLFNFKEIIFKSAIFLPVFAIILTTCLTYKSPTNTFAERTITEPGLTITINDDTDPFTFSLDAGVTHSTQQSLSINTSSAGGYLVNLETGGYSPSAGSYQGQTFLTSDLVNVAEPNDTTKRIPSLTTDTPYNNIQNAYGYNFTNGNLTVTNATIFKPAPQIIDDNGTMKSETIKLAETDHKNLTDDTYSLAIAVNADTSIPAGTYQNTLLIAVTANIADYTVYFCDNKDDQNPCDNPTQQLISEGIPEQLDPNPYTRPGYAFKGWNTKPDGTGTTYPANYKTSPGHEIEDENGVQATSGGSVNLYAMWQAEEYTVIYDGNTATAGTMNPQTILRDTPTNLTKNQYTKTGYYFAGWADAPDGNVLYTDEQQVENLAPTNGTITLYAKWTTSQYNVVYDGNHATSGTTAPQTVGYNEQLPLNANGFNRTGSRFLGWATTSWANTPKYTNSQTLTPAQVNELVAGLGHGDTVTLYAVWETPLSMAYADAGKTKVTVGSDSYYTMQDMDPSICYATNVIGDASITPVVDTRDNKIYLVTKLADNRCWMIQNLALGDMNQSKTLTPQDSDVTTNFTLPISTNGYFGDDPLVARQESSQQTFWMDGDTLYTSGTPPSSTQYIGNWYNWYTATAGSGNMSIENTIATQSICPKGWKLPTGGSINLATGNGEQSILYNAYGNYNDFLSATHPVFSGWWIGSAGMQGSAGGWWSSTNYNQAGAYILNFYYGTRIWPEVSGTKSDGASIRCLARNNYTVKFNSNGGSGTMPDQSMEYGAYTNLANYSFTPPVNKTFIGWNTNANGTGTSYQNTASVVNLAGTGTSTTLYAQYEDSCALNSICYRPNGATANGTTAYPTMSNQSATANTATTLWPSNFKRSGYGFAGWSTEPLNADASDFNAKLSAAVSAGKVYGPMETITTPAKISNLNGLNLYAVWVKSAGSLQNWGGCATLGSGSVTALTDLRDNNTYAIAKLADGNCWMIENLRLGGSSPINLTTANTDITTNITLPASTDAFINNTTALQMNAVNTTNTVANMTTPVNVNIYSYGNYYSWQAVTGSTVAVDNGDATTSICPKGWKLPFGGATTVNGSFSQLDRALGGTGEAQSGDNGKVQSAAWRSFPNNYFFSGYVNGSSLITRSSSGALWSSTAVSSGSAYNITITSGTIPPGTYPNMKYLGFGVRCATGF